MEDWIADNNQEDLLSRIISQSLDIRKLEQLGEVKKFPKNYELERAGKKAKYCYVVKSGKVLGYEYTPNGDERIYYINEPNSLLLEGNVLFDYICNVSFRTGAPSELILLDKVALTQAINIDHNISLSIMQSLTIKMLSAMNMVRQSNLHNVTWKICDLLTNYAQYYGVPYDGKVLIQEKISQQMISNLLGVNRVTVVRSINTLKDMGLIENINGYYCIRSMEKLQRYQEYISFNE